MSYLDSISSKVNNIGNFATRTGILTGTVANKFDKFFGGSDPSNKTTPKPPQDIPAISDFIASVKKEGFALTNNFTFMFTPPALVLEHSNDLGPFNGRLLNLMCESTELPSIHIDTIGMQYYGEIIDVPNKKSYGSISTTFYVDTSMYIKLFFDRWQEAIINPESRTFSFYNDYIANLAIGVFDKHGLQHSQVILFEAFPKTVSAVTLSQESRDIMKVTVGWSYRYARSFMFENSVTANSVKSGKERKQTLSDTIMGYAGNFKDYQDRFNNMTGDVSRVQSLIKGGDLGGLIGQNLGGGWF